MALDLVDTLSQLVGTPSVNPMGRPVSGPEFFEYRMTDWLQAFFERLGLPWQRQTVEVSATTSWPVSKAIPGPRPAARSFSSRASRHGAGRRHDDRPLACRGCATAAFTVAGHATSKAE